MATAPKRKTARRAPRVASEEARDGLAKITAWIDTVKNIGIMLGLMGGMFIGFWNLVGAPYAQSFINSTVNDRIGSVEQSQTELYKVQQQMAAQLEVLQATATAGQTTQSEILRLLQSGLHPAAPTTVVVPVPSSSVPATTP